LSFFEVLTAVYCEKESSHIAGKHQLLLLASDKFET
jgi:hypothetical protein